jgi:hypothetical protein
MVNLVSMTIAFSPLMLNHTNIVGDLHTKPYFLKQFAGKCNGQAFSKLDMSTWKKSIGCALAVGD